MPPDVAHECARIAALLPSQSVKRVTPELMHLTLAFIGWAPDGAVAKAAGALRSGLADEAAFRCRLGEVGAFPAQARPRVIWVGLSEGADGVNRSAVAARDALRAAGVAFDEKPPVAHLTVGRVRDGISSADRDVIAGIVRSARAESRDFDIGEVVLFESRLARAGPTYIPLERISLARRLPSPRPER